MVADHRLRLSLDAVVYAGNRVGVVRLARLLHLGDHFPRRVLRRAARSRLLCAQVLPVTEGATSSVELWWTLPRPVNASCLRIAVFVGPNVLG